MIELWLSADHDIELSFPAPAGVVRSEWLAALKALNVIRIRRSA